MKNRFLEPVGSVGRRALASGAGLLLLASACSGSGDPGQAARTEARALTSDRTSATSGATGSSSTKTAPPVRELLVKFQSSGGHAVTECAETWLKAGRPLADATPDQDDSLDRRFHAWGIRGARALFRDRVGLKTSEGKKLFDARIAATRARFGKRTARLGAAAAATAPDFTNVYLLTMNGGADAEVAAAALRQDPHVVYAQPNYRAKVNFVPDDPYYARSGSWGQTEDDLWALKKMGLATAWGTSQGEGITVAVIDSGLDATHPEISPNIWTNSAEVPGNTIDDDGNGFTDDVHGWDFVSGGNNPLDEHGHGTHVSGTIAAVGNNGEGIVGVAPKARIMPLKVFGPNGEGSTAEAAEAIIYAAQNGADVMNNSWSCSTACPSNPVVEDAVALAHSMGTVVVFAAGNSNMDIEKTAPQNRPEVIVVAASNPTDEKIDFSNFGMVDVAAPGGGPGLINDPRQRSILSLRSTVCSPDMCDPLLLVGTNLLRQAGTSMAAPHVAGLAALILKQNPTYSPEEVRQVIRRSSDDIAATGLDTQSGYGRVNAARAIIEPRPLVALITAPTTELSAVTQVDVLGSASGANMSSWRLEYGPGYSPVTYTTIATSSSPVSQGRLATWNLTTVPEGRGILRLTVTATDGRSYEDRQRFTVDNVKFTLPAPNAFVRGGDMVTITGTISPAGFSSYELSLTRADGSPAPSSNITLANGGTQPVVNGVLGTWNTAGLPTDHYLLNVTVRVASGSVVTDKQPVVVDPTLHPGWPKPLAEEFPDVSRHLTAADINGDGRAELLVGYGVEVQVLDHNGNSLPGWPRSTGMTSGAPAVGDLTGDGKPEIATWDTDGVIHVWQANGVALPGWPRVFGTSGAGGHLLVIDDIDGDGISDLVAGGADGMLRVFRSNGTMLPGFPVALVGGTPIGPLAVGDVQGNGSPKEIAVASTWPAGQLYLVSSTGVVMPGWPKSIPANSRGCQLCYQQAEPVLGDIDGDGDLEVIIGGLDGSTMAFHHTGATVAGWPKTAPDPASANPANTPSLGDVDGDGRVDIVVGGIVSGVTTFTSTLNVWRGDGTSMPDWPVESLFDYGFRGFMPAALADIDGDGRIEVVAWDQPALTSHPLRAVSAFRFDGTPVPGFPKLTRPFADRFLGDGNVIAIADLDGDGKLELATVDATATVYVWDLDAPASASAPWPMYQHDPGHTGRATPACIRETNAVFCSRLGKNCGSVTGNDNCGSPRTVSDCGTCTAPKTCGGGGTANVCGNTCTPETNAVFCSRLGKNCGSVTGNDNCGVSRTVSNCGSCTAPQTCGGGGTANVCGSSSPCGGLCQNPSVFAGPNYQSGNLGTGATCHQTSANLGGAVCGNFASGRTFKVNGTTVSCSGGNISLPAKRNEGYCFQASTGDHPWAYFATWQ